MVFFPYSCVKHFHLIWLNLPWKAGTGLSLCSLPACPTWHHLSITWNLTSLDLGLPSCKGGTALPASLQGCDNESGISAAWLHSSGLSWVVLYCGGCGVGTSLLWVLLEHGPDLWHATLLEGSVFSSLQTAKGLWLRSGLCWKPLSASQYHCIDQRAFLELKPSPGLGCSGLM